MREISLNILDLAQNSLRANATLIQITVEERTSENILYIQIEDNGIGMTPDQLLRATDPFYSDKPAKNFGLGVPFFKLASEMAGGSFSIQSELGKGTVISATFGLDHVDRMPMGNIVETLLSLLRCRPLVDFVFTCRNEEASYTADTREFRSILGDVPLNEIRILSFIGDILQENTETILLQA